MDARTLVMLTLQVSLATTVFVFGLSTTRGDLTYLLERPGLLLRSVLAIFVVMPVLAVVLVKLTGLPHTLEVVLVALAVSPVPPLLPNRQDAGSERPYGLALMVTCAVLGVVLVPLAIAILSQVFHRPLDISTAAIARLLILFAVVPVLAGVAVRMFAPAAGAALSGPLTTLAKVLLGLAVLALVISLGGVIWATMTAPTVLALSLFVVAGLAVGHVLGGPARGHAVPLALSTACRHPAIALTLASANFPGEKFGGTILVYLILNTVIGVAYMKWARR